MMPLFMFAYDAATFAAASGCTFQSSQSDMYTDELTSSMGHFHEVCVQRRAHGHADAV